MRTENLDYLSVVIRRAKPNHNYRGLRSGESPCTAKRPGLTPID
jgi:hypothetical protein